MQCTIMATAQLLDDVTECPICKEVFNDPRVLPCVHTYCLHCIEQYGKDKQPGDELACPLCRKEFTVPDNGLKNLSKNIFILKLVQIKKLSNIETEASMCEVCKFREEDDKMNVATFYCGTCRLKLCQACKYDHRQSNVTRCHHIVGFGDEAGLKKLSEDACLLSDGCQNHGNQSLKIYCDDCKHAICAMCLSERHKSHKHSDINAVAEEFREQLTDDVNKIRAFSVLCRQMLQLLSKENTNFMRQIVFIEKEIHHHAVRVKKDTEHQRQKQVADLKLKYENDLQKIHRLREEIHMHLLEMENCKKDVEELREKGTACNIVSAASGLHDRAQELLTFNVTKPTMSGVCHDNIGSTLSNDDIGDQEGNADELCEIQHSSDCEKHPEEALNSYCVDCKVLICMVCCTEWHDSHVHTDIITVAEEYRELLADDLAKVTTSVDELRQKLQDLAEAITRITKEAVNRRQEISRQAVENVQMVDDHTEILVGLLTAVKQNRMEDIDSLQAELCQQLLSVESYKKYVEELREKGTACDIVSAASGLHDRVQELLAFDAIKLTTGDLGRAEITLRQLHVGLSSTTNTIGKLHLTTCRSYEPLLTHILPANEKNIGALALLNNDVFVTRWKSRQVEVYDAATLTLQRRLNVPGLGSLSCGLAASASCMCNCVFVSDYYHNKVHRVQLTGRRNAVITWSVARHPAGLSVNSARNVLVACSADTKIQEYTLRGIRVREICLAKGVVNPWHAVQLSSGQYVVSQYKAPGEVRIVDADGEVSLRIGPLNHPLGLAVTSDDNILVADRDDHGILRMDDSFSSGEYLRLPGRLHQPVALALDASLHRLYIGEKKSCRVLVYSGFTI